MTVLLLLPTLAAAAPDSDCALPGSVWTIAAVDAAVVFDEPVAQELIVPVTGLGSLCDLRCDDPGTRAWVSADSECASHRAGDDTSYICLRVNFRKGADGAVFSCSASTPTGIWTMSYTLDTP
jgi:hypothetical protein